MKLDLLEGNVILVSLCIFTFFKMCLCAFAYIYVWVSLVPVEARR